jgi:hypothetical protein
MPQRTLTARDLLRQLYTRNSPILPYPAASFKNWRRKMLQTGSGKSFSGSTSPSLRSILALSLAALGLAKSDPPLLTL